ncbi:MAG TPA: TIGR04551 family protein [Myxococcales bacterium]|nr:TIGR04551 family protein [Myxococcales bacterium]
MRALVLAALLLLPTGVVAQDSMKIGDGLHKRDRIEIEVGGSMRLRASLLHNLDLDRGSTPSGQSLYPTLAGNSSEQTLLAAETRLRLDSSIFPMGSIAVKSRIDVFETRSLNSELVGDAPSGRPGVEGQRSTQDAFQVRWAYGEARTPLGVLVAGRTGVHWGLGILTNDGSCDHCDGGDVADRVAFVSSFLSHTWAFAFDWSANGASRLSHHTGGQNELTDAQSYSFAFMRTRSESSRKRRRRAGASHVEYGVLASYRTQDVDRSTGVELPRDLKVLALDGWSRLSFPNFVIEAEFVYLCGEIGQASIVPGVLLPQSVTIDQIGAAMKSEYGALDGAFGIGLDMGYASGDSAPGFSAYSGSGQSSPVAGDIGGYQAGPGDRSINNFRFSSDYHVDRILFREILGGVSDAIYVRPHLRYRLSRVGRGELSAELFAVFSMAVEAASTPGHKAPLAVEIDPSLKYQQQNFRALLDYAYLHPLEGLDNPEAGLKAKPAHLLKLHLAYLF